MSKKSFHIVTSTSPQTEISLSGRSGRELKMTLDGDGTSKTVLIDPESVLLLQTFLADYLVPEEHASTAPDYRPTGRALAIMDAETLDIVNVLLAGDSSGNAGAEDEDYESIVEKFSHSDIDIPQKPLFIFYDFFDGTIGRPIIRQIIRACITYQLKYIRSGKPTDCRPMSLKHIEDFTGIDQSVISRATHNVRIVTPSGIFTLNSSDPSLSTPSLFDEGAARTDGTRCSRKEVFVALQKIIQEENPRKPMVDEDFAAMLQQMGYDIARRTVAKYRGLLDIPNTNKRRFR